ncbi:MAG: hypothetical protein WAO02_04640 [Verrucomicrobiia bacterium]
MLAIIPPGLELKTPVAGTIRKSEGQFSDGQALSGACDNLVKSPTMLYLPRMRRNCRSITTSPEIVKHIDGLTEANFNLLTRLIGWLAENEKRQEKYRTAVLIRLAQIESMLTQVQGCQLAEYWPPTARITDEQRDQYLKEVESRTAVSSEYLLSKMVRYIYGDDPIPEVRHDRRKKWHAWEI